MPGSTAVDGAGTPLMRDLLEAIAAELGMARGHWRLELRYHEGRLQNLWRHDEQLPPGALERFESEALRDRVRDLVAQAGS